MKALSPGKKAETNRANTGSFAPQGINGAVKMVSKRSRHPLIVREDITPGTAQPPAIPPETMKGRTELP